MRSFGRSRGARRVRGRPAGPGFRDVDLRLAAVAGTAVGTVPLAGFTGALAWTTSGDVRATIRLADTTQEDQRARNRPIVGAAGGGDVRCTRPDRKEDGPRAPALDQERRARAGAQPLPARLVPGALVPIEEVITVVAVDEEITQRGISLAGIREPKGGRALPAASPGETTADVKAGWSTPPTRRPGSSFHPHGPASRRVSTE